MLGDRIAQTSERNFVSSSLTIYSTQGASEFICHNIGQSRKKFRATEGYPEQ
jgi:hypothetical protein